MSAHNIDDRVYNKSLKSAYADLLMERMGSHSASMAVDDNDDDDLEEYEMGMIQDDDEDAEEGENDYYRKFKKSIINEYDDGKNSIIDDADDDRWLDDNSTLDHDYTNEADKSFYDDHEDDDDENNDNDLAWEELEHSDDENDLYYDEDKASKFSLKTWILITFLGVLLIFINPFFTLPNENVVSSSPSTMTALQKQINHLYSELDHRDQENKSNFDRTIKVVISQFEKKIKELLPSNFVNLQNQLESLSNKVNKLSYSLAQWENNSGPMISMDNITDWQDRLVQELETRLPQEIPVVVNNSSSILVIPELRNYLTQLISSLVQNSNLPSNSKPLEYDLNQYVKEILANQFQYVDKDYFISELNRNLQMNKQEIWQEMTTKLEQWKSKNVDDRQNISPHGIIPQQYSNILLKKLINQIYNANQHQWEDDLDFATFAQGMKLLNHLTSSTWNQGNGISPVELLQDSRYGSSTYWQCGSPKSCSWAARFKEPVYLTRLSYIHGRFNNNLHMMNSAPKIISVYVSLAKTNSNVKTEKLIALAKSFKQGQLFANDNQHIRIGQYHYSLTDNKIRQVLKLPSWFIQLKPLVRSIVFHVDENHGNKHFTSLRKFIINAVTQEDLHIMESHSFPLRSDDAPEYVFSSPQMFHSVLSDVQPRQEPAFGVNDDDVAGVNEKILSFGQDEVDAS